jgi:PilZ domain
MDQSLKDRRSDARFTLPPASITRATLRPGCAVRVVDLSAGGALVQAGQPLRPGARVHFQLVTTVQAFALVARILRCAVWTLDAEAGAVYRGALQFEDRFECAWEPESLQGPAAPGDSRADEPCGKDAVPAVASPKVQPRALGVK